MNHVIDFGASRGLRPALNVSAGPPQDPIEAATRAIEQVLAAAHEAGQQEAVRLLHAVTALLAATPRA